MKKAILFCLLFSLVGCATTEKVVVVSTPDFTWMNKDNGPGLVIVVPPSEIRTLREMVITNQAKIAKVEVTANTALATANDAKAIANTALENQSTFNNLLQALSNRIDDYRKACEAMWSKILKK
jgi:spore germination protein YaaH